MAREQGWLDIATSSYHTRHQPSAKLPLWAQEGFLKTQSHGVRYISMYKRLITKADYV